MTRKARVLLVEDDPCVRLSFAMMLAEIGCEVVEAADGAEALDRFARTPCDLLVTDLNLGEGRRGEDVAVELTRRRPSLPVLYVSGDYVSLSRVAGPNRRLLQKPVPARTFFDAVHELLETA